MPATLTAADVTTLFAQGFDACVFATSLVAKAHRPRALADFTDAVRRLAPRVPARPAAAAVVLGELAVVLSLLAGAVAPGLALALVLVAAFTATIAAALRARRRVACQCFGQSQGPVSAVHLVRNAVILAVTAAGLGTLGLTTRGGPVLSAAAIGVLGVAAVAAACVVVLDRFSDLFVLNPKEQ